MKQILLVCLLLLSANATASEMNDSRDRRVPFNKLIAHELRDIAFEEKSFIETFKDRFRTQRPIGVDNTLTYGLRGDKRNMIYFVIRFR